MLDTEAAVAKLKAAREVAAQIRREDLIESDELYAEVERTAQECESLTWTVAVERPRIP